VPCGLDVRTDIRIIHDTSCVVRTRTTSNSNKWCLPLLHKDEFDLRCIPVEGIRTTLDEVNVIVLEEIQFSWPGDISPLLRMKSHGGGCGGRVGSV
jgi:hypothetical protein